MLDIRTRYVKSTESNVPCSILREITLYMRYRHLQTY